VTFTSGSATVVKAWHAPAAAVHTACAASMPPGQLVSGSPRAFHRLSSAYGSHQQILRHIHAAGTAGNAAV